MQFDDSLLPARRARGLALLRDGAVASQRVAVLGTFNLELLPPFLAEALDRTGISALVEAAPFGQLAASIVDADSELYASSPDAVLLVAAAEDLGVTPETVDDSVAELRHLVAMLLERLPRATCYVVVYGADTLPNAHVLDPLAAERGQAAFARFDDGVRSLGAQSERVVVVDWDWHVRGPGRAAQRDPRLWYLARMRLAQRGVAALAELVAEHIAAARGTQRKVCAFDLDGVLWGGIVGEDGLAGIELGEDGRGLAFQDLQRELLTLRAAGTLLVACSKNNEQDAFEALDSHSGMLLRREHLAAYRINWQDKAENLRELAGELGLGLDSFVFFDDTAFERERVRSALPEVVVPDLPDDPVERPDFVRAGTWFRRIRTTGADLTRADAYRAEGERRQVRAQSASLDEFLRSLDQRITIAAVDEGTLGRAAQLSQRTNQFNLTTRRYSVAELEAALDDPAVEVWTLALRDRYGDSGVTGLAILRTSDDEALIDTLLLSCRVLGRRVEDALLAFLAERAAALGAGTLVGHFVPTAKNAQVASFYPARGFEEAGDGVFRLALEPALPPWPEGIEAEIRAGA